MSRFHLTQSKLKQAALFALVALAVSAAPSELLAQTPSGNTDLQLPGDLPPIPSVREKESTLILSAKNVALFHELLLAPIAAWLKEGKFAVRLVKELELPWNYSPDFVAASRANSALLDVGESGEMVRTAEGTLREGLPFGLSAELDRESDPRRKAQKILWNAAFASQPVGASLYTLDMLWFGNSGMQRRASAAYFSLVSSLSQVPISSATPALFRQDLLQFASPPVVFGFSVLSWRYFGVRDDSVWMYSPVIGKSRPVFSANRGDPLLGSLLNFDDLLLTSLKVESLSARVVDEKTLLVPFPSLGLTDLQREASTELVPPAEADAANASAVTPPAAAAPNTQTLTARGAFRGREGQSSFVLWNSESGQFPQAPAWVPSSVFLVPRRVWIVEISKNDPFYLMGRQILVIDKESMLPVYKIVYDRAGLYLKTIAGGWALTSIDDGQIRIPVVAFLLGLDRKMNSAVGLSTTSFRYFRSQPGAANESELLKRYRSLLNIAEHEKTAPAAPAAEAPTPSSKESAPAEKKSDEIVDTESGAAAGPEVSAHSKSE